MPILTATTNYAGRATITSPFTEPDVAYLNGGAILGNVSGVTFSQRSIGSATAGRQIYAVLHTRGTTGVTLSSATIGGISATIHVQQYETFVGSDDGVTIFSAAVPTGSYADVVISYSGNVSRHFLALYRVASLAAHDDSDSKAVGGASDTGTLTLTTVVGGSLIAGCSVQSGGNLVKAVYTNATENYDENVNDVGTSGGLATSIAGVSLGVSAALSEAGCLGAFAAVSFH